MVLTGPVQPTLLYEARLFWYNMICRQSVSSIGSPFLTTLTHILQADERKDCFSWQPSLYIPTLDLRIRQ